MKTSKFRRRFYRDFVTARKLHQKRIILKETDVQIITDKKLDEEFAIERINFYRRQIEDYIIRDPRFIVALKPISIELTAPEIIKKMSEVSHTTDVGPMAAVAGAVAEFLGKDLLKHGYKDVIVENGGDIFMKLRRACKVGIYAGRSKVWNHFKLNIKPLNTSLGVCTSSGTIGHSLSFGSADAVIILAKTAYLSDAVATACGNRVHFKKDLKPALDFARSIKGVKGVVIIMKKDLLSWGNIEFTK
jgi:hypothetical protein